MKQIGLDTHIHNYTLNYPFGGGKVFTGTNVYGILRAPRIGSTEGIVYSAPFRPKDSLEPDISASIPILLAFAESARKKNYWAKDFVFLVTDNEQLGIQAWLEAYHLGGLQSDQGILNSGSLRSRAGALQAALNLEIQGMDLDYINVKLEGLNGGLPNLDYFNLVQRITAKERIAAGYKQTARKTKYTPYVTKIEENLKHILSMIFTQANCVPTGNHGLFHQYRIEALTLEGIKAKNSHQRPGVLSVLKSIEGISRSLNNLLEKFHQSFFFYILVHNDRFISIGDYMPCAILFVAVFFIKSFLMWHDLNTKVDKWNDDIYDKKHQGEILEIRYTQPIVAFACAVLTGFSLNFVCKSGKISDIAANQFGLTTENTVALLLLLFVFIGLMFPLFFKFDDLELQVLQIGSQVFVGCILLTVSLLNFSLGFLLGVCITPLGFNEVGERKVWLRKCLNSLYIILAHPALVIYYFAVAITEQNFDNLSFNDFIEKVFIAFSNIATYGVVDNLVSFFVFQVSKFSKVIAFQIYGNWMFPIITLALFPAWILYYSINIRDWVLSGSARKKKVE